MNYEDDEQSEEPEADADHERDSGMTPNEDESHESMEVDESPPQEFSPH